MDEERSAADIPIYRHDEEVAGAGLRPDPAFVAALTAHVETHYGEVTAVVPDVDPGPVDVDVLVVAPNDRQPVYTLVTAGMSTHPRPAPDGTPRWNELIVHLPPDWPQEERWPFELLQDLGRTPHRYDTTLLANHTVGNGDPPEPYARATRFSGALVTNPLIAPEGCARLQTAGRDIEFLAVFPLHADELAYRLEHGTEALFDLLDEAELIEIVDNDRPSVVPKRRRRLFGLRTRGGS